MARAGGFGPTRRRSMKASRAAGSYLIARPTRTKASECRPCDLHSASVFGAMPRKAAASFWSRSFAEPNASGSCWLLSLDIFCFLRFAMSERAAAKKRRRAFGVGVGFLYLAREKSSTVRRSGKYRPQKRLLSRTREKMMDFRG